MSTRYVNLLLTRWPILAPCYWNMVPRLTKTFWSCSKISLQFLMTFPPQAPPPQGGPFRGCEAMNRHCTEISRPSPCGGGACGQTQIIASKMSGFRPQPVNFGFFLLGHNHWAKIEWCYFLQLGIMFTDAHCVFSGWCRHPRKSVQSVQSPKAAWTLVQIATLSITAVSVARKVIGKNTKFPAGWNRISPLCLEISMSIMGVKRRQAWILFSTRSLVLCRKLQSIHWSDKSRKNVVLIIIPMIYSA